MDRRRKGNSHTESHTQCLNAFPQGESLDRQGMYMSCNQTAWSRADYVGLCSLRVSPLGRDTVPPKKKKKKDILCAQILYY